MALNLSKIQETGKPGVFVAVYGIAKSQIQLVTKHNKLSVYFAS